MPSMHYLEVKQKMFEFIANNSFDTLHCAICAFYRVKDCKISGYDANVTLEGQTLCLSSDELVPFVEWFQEY